MNIPIRRVAIAVMVMVVILLANVTYIQVFDAKSLSNNPHNARVLLDEYSRQRGTITAGDEVIASSIATSDRLKYLRTYPKNTAAMYAPITGYYSYQYFRSGIEKAEDPLLSGNDDRLFGQRFRDLFAGRDPRGGNAVTTIDPAIQAAAWKSMQTGCEGPCRGAAVAIEPSTGKILALVSTPSYDPNLLASHDPDVAEKAWDALNPSNQVSPMLNRAINAAYPPGSTFKVLDAIAALQQHVGVNTRLTASPNITLPNTNTPVSNYGGETCPGSSNGTVSMTTAFQYSCNTAFVDLTTSKLTNPIASIKAVASSFGIDDQFDDIPLPVSESTVGPIADLAGLGLSSIGQLDVQFTPLQNAVIAATIANGGVRMKPYLIDRLQRPDLRTLSTTQPQVVNNPISPDVAHDLTALMIASEKYTKGYDGSDIASKTGTAEHAVGRTTDETPYAWYIAFGPTQNAKVAVAVIVENGNAGLQSTGGSYAAPVGRAMIAAGLGR